MEAYLYIRNNKRELTNVQFNFVNYPTSNWWSKPNYEYKYEYDEKGRETLSEYYFYSKSQTPQTRIASIYADDGKCIQQTTLTLHLAYTYDNLNRLVMKEESGINSNVKRETKYSYDDNGNLSSYVQISTLPDDTVGSANYSYKYDIHNQVKEAIFLNWSYNTNRWDETEGKTTFYYKNTYDNSNRLISSESSSYDASLNQLITRNATDYTYNERGDKIWIINRKKDSLLGWVPGSKVTRDYNTAGNITLSEETIWNPDKEQWEGKVTPQNVSSLTPGEQRFERKEWTCDEDNNRMSGKYYVWDGESNFIL